MSQQLIAPKARTVCHIGLGGTGINMVRSYRETQSLDNKAFLANEAFFYVDTSLANLNNVAIDEVYLLPKADGSGADRSKNAREFYAKLPEIMLKLPKADHYVLSFSMSGGTGAAGGPLLLERLLAEGHSACMAGSYDTSSNKRITNFIGAVQGLQMAVDRIGRPIALSLVENDPKKSLSENNVVPKFVINALSYLMSGKNDHLDSADINSFFDFHKVTHQKPGLALLEAFVREEDIQSIGHAISYAALMNSHDVSAPRIPCDYDTVGFLPSTEADSKRSFFYTLSAERLNVLLERMTELQGNVEQQKKVTSTATDVTRSLAGQVDDVTGLVL